MELSKFSRDDDDLLMRGDLLSFTLLPLLRPLLFGNFGGARVVKVQQ